MQTRSAARNKKNDNHDKRLGRRESKDSPQLKSSKKQATPSPPQGPSSPERSESDSPASPLPQLSTHAVPSSNKPNEINTSTESPSTFAPTSRPLSRSMTLRSSLGSRPKRRIWSPENSKKSDWQDEAKFHRMPIKKGRGRPPRRYESESSSLSSSDSEKSESSEQSKRQRGFKKKKTEKHKRILSDSSEESELDGYDSDSTSDSLDSGDDNSSAMESDDDSASAKRKRKHGRYSELQKRKQHRENDEGIKSDTEGAEALLDLAAGSLVAIEENRRAKPHKTPTRSYSRPVKRPRPSTHSREDRPRDPSFDIDIRNFLVPPPVFPKMASGQSPPGAPPAQPIWKRGALHAAIAYYVFYQQRYDLLQQLSVPNAQYAQKFLLALSLDPTAEAKMLRERAESAKLQLRSKSSQEKASTPPPTASDIYSKSSPSQTSILKSPKAVSPIALASSAPSILVSSTDLQDTPMDSNPLHSDSSIPSISLPHPIDTALAPTSNLTGSQSPLPDDASVEQALPLVTFSEIIPAEPTLPQQNQISTCDSSSFSSHELPSTPTTENTSLEEVHSFDGNLDPMQLDFSSPKTGQDSIQTDELNSLKDQDQQQTSKPIDDPVNVEVTSEEPPTTKPLLSPKPIKPIPSSEKSQNSPLDLNYADWASFPLGSAFRKGRLGAFTPAQVMVSPFNYLMSSPIEGSRSFKYTNSDTEDSAKQPADQRDRQQHWQHVSKVYSQYPYSMYYNQYPYSQHEEDAQRSQPATYNNAQMPHSLYEWQQQYHSLNRSVPAQESQPQPQYQRPAEQTAHSGVANHQSPSSAPYASASTSTSVSPSPSSPSPQTAAQLDQRSASITHPLVAPEASRPDPTQPTTTSTDQISWAQQYSPTLYKQHHSVSAPVQQEQMQVQPQHNTALQGSTENLANLKRQIRSKALAARGNTMFSGGIRRNPDLHQPHPTSQNEQQPAGYTRYIIINDDTHDKSTPGGDAQNVDKEQKEKPVTVDIDKEVKAVPVAIVDPNNPPSVQILPYPPHQQQQQQLQQHLRQQQQKQLQMQREQAALLEYQRQMHQRPHFAISEPVHKITIQPSRPPQVDQPSLPSNTQPQPQTEPSNATPSYTQSNLQRLQQLHFQFKHQRMQQMQKQQGAQAASNNQQSQRALTPHQYAQYAQNQQQYVQQLAQHMNSQKQNQLSQSQPQQSLSQSQPPAQQPQPSQSQAHSQAPSQSQTHPSAQAQTPQSSLQAQSQSQSQSQPQPQSQTQTQTQKPSQQIPNSHSLQQQMQQMAALQQQIQNQQASNQGFTLNSHMQVLTPAQLASLQEKSRHSQYTPMYQQEQMQYLQAYQQSQLHQQSQQLQQQSQPQPAQPPPQSQPQQLPQSQSTPQTSQTQSQSQTQTQPQSQPQLIGQQVQTTLQQTQSKISTQQPTTPRSNMQQWQVPGRQFKVAPQGSFMLNSSLQNTRNYTPQHTQIPTSPSHKTNPNQSQPITSGLVLNHSQSSTSTTTTTTTSTATQAQPSFTFTPPTNPFIPPRKQNQHRLQLEPLVRPPTMKGPLEKPGSPQKPNISPTNSIQTSNTNVPPNPQSGTPVMLALQQNSQVPTPLHKSI